MDTLRYNYQRFRKPQIDVEPGKYLVFTLNRKALMADEEKLAQLLRAMVEAADGLPIIAPLRGKAYEMVDSINKTLRTKILIINSLSYLEFGWLTSQARGIITDSGNVAEEATFNHVPCITLNSYTEHQETVTIGSNVLVGEDPQKLREAIALMVAGKWKESALPDRWDGRTAERIVSILLK